MLLKYDNTVRQIFAVQELRLNIHQIFRSHLSKDSQVTATAKPPGLLHGITCKTMPVNQSQKTK